jgi:GTPase SAR1 family protein
MTDSGRKESKIEYSQFSEIIGVNAPTKAENIKNKFSQKNQPIDFETMREFLSILKGKNVSLCENAIDWMIQNNNKMELGNIEELRVMASFLPQNMPADKLIKVIGEERLQQLFAQQIKGKTPEEMRAWVNQYNLSLGKSNLPLSSIDRLFVTCMQVAILEEYEHQREADPDEGTQWRRGRSKKDKIQAVETYTEYKKGLLNEDPSNKKFEKGNESQVATYKALTQKSLLRETSQLCKIRELCEELTARVTLKRKLSADGRLFAAAPAPPTSTSGLQIKPAAPSQSAELLNILDILVMGPEGGGKTQLINLLAGKPTSDHVVEESNVQNISTSIAYQSGSRAVSMRLLETGTRQQREGGRVQYSGASAAVICIDVTKDNFLEMMKKYIKEVTMFGKGMPIVLVVTKADIANASPEGQHRIKEVEEYAGKVGQKCFLVSTKDEMPKIQSNKSNISKAVQSIASQGLTFQEEKRAERAAREKSAQAEQQTAPRSSPTRNV